MATAPSTADLMRELAAETCRCGAPKRPRTTFCLACYRRLPPALRRALYQRIGQGYEEAHAAAMAAMEGKR